MNRRDLLRVLGIAGVATLINPTELFPQQEERLLQEAITSEPLVSQTSCIRTIPDEVLRKYLSEKSFNYVTDKYGCQNLVVETIADTESGWERQFYDVRYLQYKSNFVKTRERVQEDFLKHVNILIEKGVFGLKPLAPPMAMSLANPNEMIYFFFAPVVKIEGLSWREIRELKNKDLNKYIGRNVFFGEGELAENNNYI